MLRSLLAVASLVAVLGEQGLTSVRAPAVKPDSQSGALPSTIEDVTVTCYAGGCGSFCSAGNGCVQELSKVRKHSLDYSTLTHSLHSGGGRLRAFRGQVPVDVRAGQRRRLPHLL